MDRRLKMKVKIFERSGEAWMFEEEGPTLVATFAEALGNLAV